MAVKLYRKPNGALGGWDSIAKTLMVAPTQEEFEDCCCEGPCEKCAGWQPPALVDMEGSCGNDFNGFWDFLDFTPYENEGGSKGCDWQWKSAVVVGNFIILRVRWNYEGSGYWEAATYPSWAVPPGQCVFSGIELDIECDGETGHLEGSFIIPNTGDEPGLNASITLG